jgi:hypothetical protein
MKNLFRCIALVALSAAVVSPARAAELQLTIANGRVTLIAQDVPIRQILAEWARLGQTRIINGEKLAGPPVTLHIVDKPEREVLEAVLRSASGYVAAPRLMGAAGASMFETVMIMPTSRPPAVTASAPPAFNQRPGFPQPHMQPQPQPQPIMPVMVEDEDGETRDQGVVPPPGVMPPGAVNVMPQQPGMQPHVQPYPGMVQQPDVAPQPGTAQQPGQPTPITAPRPGLMPTLPQATPGNPYQPPQQPVRRPGGEGL